MNKPEAILTQTVKQLESMNEAIVSSRRELLPGQPKKFAILAESPLEDLRRLQLELEQLTAQIATALPRQPEILKSGQALAVGHKASH